MDQAAVFCVGFLILCLNEIITMVKKYASVCNVNEHFVQGLKLLLDAHFSCQSTPLRVSGWHVSERTCWYLSPHLRPEDLDLNIWERVADFCFGQGQAVAFLAGWRKPLPDPSPTMVCLVAAASFNIVFDPGVQQTLSSA